MAGKPLLRLLPGWPPMLRVERGEGRLEEGKLLHAVEALYLLYRGDAEALDTEGKPLGFRGLMDIYASRNPYAWVEFEVYLDLRRRGRLVETGPRPHSFLVRKSKKDPRYRYYVLVFEESRSAPVSVLRGFVEEALRNGWEPLLAIVDRYGDVIYYGVGLLRPRRLEEARWLGRGGGDAEDNP